MLRVLAYLIGTLFILVGLLAGGCSVLFTPSLFQTGEFTGSGILPIWGMGVGAAVVGLGIGIWIFRSLKASARRVNPSVADDPKDQP